MQFFVQQQSVDGPCFGGYDISITNKSNTNTGSNSNLGKYSYAHPDYAEGSNEAKSFLAGLHKFLISEIEVFTK